VKTLIVVAHPDDEALAFGGFIAKYHRKAEIRIIFLAEGVSARLSSTSKEDLSIEIAKRNKGLIYLRNNLGIADLHTYEYKCGNLHLVDPVELHRIIESHIEEFQPNLILTHWNGDNHIDHRATLDCVLVATRPIGIKKSLTVISGEVPSSSEWRFDQSFSPNLFLSLSEHELQLKISMMKSYTEEMREFPFPRSPRAISALAQFRGVQFGTEYAETYRIVRGNLDFLYMNEMC
jgi:LmbE family N-acetylglucosaminyl deacetylase